MRSMKWASAMAVAGAVTLLGSMVPAWAGAALPWVSPNKIVSGVPVHVASIAPCPPVPTPGDTVLVQVNLSFGSGGSSGQIVTPNADGSWSGDVTFFFSGVNVRQTDINAECLDFFQFGANPYAQYQDHHTQIFN